MLWIYLIVQAIGLGIIAWSFKAEDKDEYATPFEIGGLLSLSWVIAAAPLPLKVLTGFLIVRFRSRINHAFSSGQAAILSCFRRVLHALTPWDSTGFDPVSRRMLEPLFLFLNQPIFCGRQAQPTANAQYPNPGIIDVEAVEVSYWY